MTARRDPTVFVVDDDPALCDALRVLITAEQLSVEIFASAELFLAAYEGDWPGCLILDHRLHGMTGIALLRELARRNYSLPVILLTAHGDVPLAVQALHSGALEFLQKPVRDEVLLERIQAALRIDAQRRLALANRAETLRRLATLSAREREVLDLLVDGRGNKQIAAALSISEKTVEVHRKHVMKKMAVGALVDLVRLILHARRT